jgi:hypothetical protein
MTTGTDRRLGALEARLPQPASPRDAELRRVDAWLSTACGCTFDELAADDLCRIMQLLDEGGDFAHPLILRAFVTPPEDREPAKPALHGLPSPPKNVPWEDPRVAPPADTPEWRAWKRWQRRRWGYDTAAGDPEAAAIAGQLQAWAASPERPYLRGADLALLFARLGVEWPAMGYFDLRRLAALCAALDQLALEHPDLQAPPAVFWCVLGWEGHRRPSGFFSDPAGAVA